MLVQIDAEILIRQIQQDIRMKDLESLREHFDQFCAEDRFEPVNTHTDRLNHTGHVAAVIQGVDLTVQLSLIFSSFSGGAVRGAGAD